MSDAVFLLAAGRGQRAGGPKAWQPYHGRTLPQAQLDFIRPRFAAPDVRVSIQEAWLMKCQGLDPAVDWIAVDPKASPLGALQGLWRKAPPSGWAFVWHVDMPVWEPKIFEKLKVAAASSDAEALAPRSSGRKGHPVLLSANLGPELLALDPVKDRLDHFLRTRKEASVDVPFDCIHANWNTAEELA